MSWWKIYYLMNSSEVKWYEGISGGELNTGSIIRIRPFVAPQRNKGKPRSERDGGSWNTDSVTVQYGYYRRRLKPLCPPCIIITDDMLSEFLLTACLCLLTNKQQGSYVPGKVMEFWPSWKSHGIFRVLEKFLEFWGSWKNIWNCGLRILCPMKSLHYSLLLTVTTSSGSVVISNQCLHFIARLTVLKFQLLVCDKL